MRRWCGVLVLTLSLLLSGCWDRVEINDLAIVKIVAVDKTERGIQLTVRIVAAKHGRTGGGSEAQMITDVFTAEGESIADAAQSLQRQISRRLFWAHSGPLIIGEELARQGVLPVLDYWSRFSEPRMNTYVVVTPGRGHDLAQATPALERLLGEAIREITNMRQAVPTRIRDLLGSIRTAGDNPVAPRFERVSAIPDDPADEVRTTGTAVFRHDRLAGWMDEAETQGLLMLRDEMQTGVVRVELPGGHFVTMRIVRSNTNVRAYSDRGRIRIAVYIRPEGDVLDSSGKIDLGKTEVLEALDQKLAAKIKQRVLETIRKAQHDLGVDVLRFGDAVRRDLPYLWDDGLSARWDKEFLRTQVEVTVHASIRRTGANGPPLGERPETVKKETGDLLRQMR